MVICIDCSPLTRKQLEELVGKGGYANISEVIAVAVSNQVLLETGARNGEIVIAEQDAKLAQVRDQRNAVQGASSGKTVGPNRATPRAESKVESVHWGIPDLFKVRLAKPWGPIADPGEDEINRPDPLPPSLWIFGQFNKLLPVKASCRALANLLVNSNGAELNSCAKRIANEASELGNLFRVLDRKHQRSRDELMSTAFPGTADPDRGRIRYANQFVAAINKRGQLSGLLYDLKLINIVSSRDTRLSLTQAGWTFALMDNPALDDTTGQATDKFSEEERTFLLDYIASNVPRERSAYTAILSAIANGNATPESLAQVLSALEEQPDQNPFLATQRSGAISRMYDLSLLNRERDGIRVKYITTEDGATFLREALRQPILSVRSELERQQ